MISKMDYNINDIRIGFCYAITIARRIVSEDNHKVASFIHELDAIINKYQVPMMKNDINIMSDNYDIDIGYLYGMSIIWRQFNSVYGQVRIKCKNTYNHVNSQDLHIIRSIMRYISKKTNANAIQKKMPYLAHAIILDGRHQRNVTKEQNVTPEHEMIINNVMEILHGIEKDALMTYRRPLAVNVPDVKKDIRTVSLETMRDAIINHVNGTEKFPFKTPEQSNPPAPPYQGSKDALLIPMPGYNKTNVIAQIVSRNNRKELIITDMETKKSIKKVDITSLFSRINFENVTFLDGMMVFPYKKENDNFTIIFK